MKKNKKLPIILLALIVTMTGCTKYLTNGKQRVTNPTTGQALTSNILCLPEDKELLKIYEENKKNLAVNFDSLKPCNKYSPGNIKYQGLWDALFIKPLAWIIIKVGILVKNYGLSVMILGVLIRLALLPFTKKSLMQSTNMKKAQPELQAIQKKYANNQDKAQAMMMSQEMMMVYKKYGINPASGCLMPLIQLPLLLAFLEAINRVPAIFEGTFLTMQLGTSPSIGIKNGDFLYIILIALIVLTTYFSYKNSMNSSTGNAEQDAQMQMTMKFMIVFIAIASLQLPTALALYWIVTNGFMIIQNKLVMKASEQLSSSGRVINSKKNKKK